jgi:hypothetical protein
MILSPGASFISPAPDALALRPARERLPPDRPPDTTILRL